MTEKSMSAEEFAKHFDKWYGVGLSKGDIEWFANEIRARDQAREREVMDGVARMCEKIQKTDKTPQYEYGEINVLGDLPAEGRRWLTPREIAKNTLERIKQARAAMEAKVDEKGEKIGD